MYCNILSHYLLQALCLTDSQIARKLLLERKSLLKSQHESVLPRSEGIRITGNFFRPIQSLWCSNSAFWMSTVCVILSKCSCHFVWVGQHTYFPILVHRIRNLNLICKCRYCSGKICFLFWPHPIVTAPITLAAYSPSIWERNAQILTTEKSFPWHQCIWD